MRIFRNCKYWVRFQTSSVKTSVTHTVDEGGSQSCLRDEAVPGSKRCSPNGRRHRRRADCLTAPYPLQHPSDSRVFIYYERVVADATPATRPAEVGRRNVEGFTPYARALHALTRGEESMSAHEIRPRVLRLHPAALLRLLSALAPPPSSLISHPLAPAGRRHAAPRGLPRGRPSDDARRAPRRQSTPCPPAAC